MVLDVEIEGFLNSTRITENHSEHKWRISVRLERADDRSVSPCADVRSACQGAQLSCSYVRTFSAMCVLCSFCPAFFVLVVCDLVMSPIVFCAGLVVVGSPVFLVRVCPQILRLRVAARTRSDGDKCGPFFGLSCFV